MPIFTLLAHLELRTTPFSPDDEDMEECDPSTTIPTNTPTIIDIQLRDERNQSVELTSRPRNIRMIIDDQVWQDGAASETDELVANDRRQVLYRSLETSSDVTSTRHDQRRQRLRDR
jgi:hypothetical protein